jgi:hypothetical protein
MQSRKDENSSLNEFFLKEIEFTKQQINQRTIYQSDHQKLLKRIHKHQEKIEKTKSYIPGNVKTL